jgi:hypothetical protein
VQSTEYSVIADLAFACILMLAFLAILKRKALPGLIRWEIEKAKQLLRGFLGLFGRKAAIR